AQTCKKEGEKMNIRKAEMVRCGVSNTDIQNEISCSETTVKNKLNGKTEFTFPECLKIRDTFFKSYRLEYLFAADRETA
ncbi:MAG: hypothetical protein LUD03_01605, partial [Firmicutes bacterium]|nr:hypothetical protein [Bacillota bacterium]